MQVLSKIGCILLAFVCCLTFAETNPVRFSGFGNISIATSDSDEFGFRHDLSQSEGVFNGDLNFSNQSKIGAQIEYQISPHLSSVAQIIYQDQEHSDLEDAIRLAFVKYQPQSNIDVRFGRLPLDLFMLTEFRDVDIAYPWAKVPTESYGFLESRYLNGVDMTYRLAIGNSTLAMKAFWGESIFKIFSLGEYTEVDVNKQIGTSVELSDFHYSVSVRYTQAELGNSIASLNALIEQINTLTPIFPNATLFSSGFSLQDSQAEYISAAGRYDFENWSLYGELSRISGDSNLVRDLTSGYLSPVLNAGDWQWYASYSFADSNSYSLTKDSSFNLPLEQLPAELQYLFGQAQAAANFFSAKQHTYSIGGRWNFDESKAFTLQLDRTIIEPNGSTLWVSKQFTANSQQENINTVFFSVSFSF